jgi:hypothetical protein
MTAPGAASIAIIALGLNLTFRGPPADHHAHLVPVEFLLFFRLDFGAGFDFDFLGHVPSMPESVYWLTHQAINSAWDGVRCLSTRQPGEKIPFIAFYLTRPTLLPAFGLSGQKRQSPE